jgi:DMSO/TMAO reductase YedYZ molybdopterin-dependent catalytic subunit
MTVSRRSLLEWLGKSTVLALGADLIASCSEGQDDYLDGGEPMAGEDSGAALDDGGFEAGHDAGADGGDAGTDCSAKGQFGFEPGQVDLEIFENWGERTVDVQDPLEIMKSWRLIVDGMVEHPLDLSFADILKMKRQDQVVDFHCVEGWSIWDVPWNGVHLNELFDLVKPLPKASHVTFHTVGDKYNESVPIDVAREPKTVLSYGIGCSTLPLKHGFPLRLVIPRKLAYKSAKYVYRIELTDEPVNGYWVEVGYPYDAEVPPERLRPGKY